MNFNVMDPDPITRVELAIEDIRAGRMVILIDDEDRENEGDLTLAADAVTAEKINFMATHGKGLICLSMTEQQIEKLELPMMVANNQSPYHTAFTVSIEAREGVSTGISAADRSHTIKTAIQPECRPHDLVTPGHIFPLKARKGGVLVRIGQTEGSVDLSRLAGLTPAGVICEIMNDDGTMARLPDLIKFGHTHNIRIVAVADLVRYRLRTETLVEKMVDTQSELGTLGRFRIQIFRSMTDNKLHVAISKGDISGSDPILTRVQAASHVVDVFGFSTSDSASQLALSLEKIREEGKGVLLYLNVSGIGAEETLRALRVHLGEIPQEGIKNAIGDGALREMGTGAQILVQLGVHNLKLMTNNPRKIIGLEGFGLKVTSRVPLEVPQTEQNKAYLQAKRTILGHLL
jgi:3,4-dihydroxy 2-butanone 4-phosphate synthase / GTP cyclohydrolase II